MYNCHILALSQLDLGVDPSVWELTTTRSRANLLHDLVMDAAKHEFADDADFTYVESNQLKSLVTPWFSLRVKKGRTGFIRLPLNKTHRTQQWTHWTQLQLPGDLAKLDKLFMAYRVDREWTIVVEIALIEYRNGAISEVITIPAPETPAYSDQPDSAITPSITLNKDSIRRVRQSEMFSDEAES